ncbi:hypothetical protein [Brevundimonas sp. NIBR11]|uniref:hypothetical protein n=1 Tax=Brevundimonas sp. NIBR11 TaxID=3015999 RepID=UPI0022F031AD|nr:hypothetical protein [Brevundimonas sp. NIBR11]WGM32255.1 hypothetical protein KKHFBJBL_02506 [Brevundimonas sp. NIBR11]
MKRILAAIALACAAVLPAACNPEGETPAAAETPPPAEAAERAPAASTTASAVPGSSSGEPAAPGAPSFAALYPGAVLDAPAVTASSASGPGGLATYTTDADPDAVIAFHRARAEAAGLSSSMAMNQGDARAYGATSADGDANLQVVASATEAGPTSVQISWSAGR